MLVRGNFGLKCRESCKKKWLEKKEKNLQFQKNETQKKRNNFERTLFDRLICLDILITVGEYRYEKLTSVSGWQIITKTNTNTNT